jgi:hypothetical protein
LWNTSGLASLTGFSAGTFYRKDVAGALANAGAGFSQIAHGIAAGISGTTLGNVAYALHNGVGAGFDQIANTLWNTSGLASLTGFSAGTFYRKDVAGALGSAGAGFSDIAHGIAAGISGTTLGNIAYALRNGLGAGFDQIANTLWNTSGLASLTGFSAGTFYRKDVAGALGAAGAGFSDIAHGIAAGISGTTLGNIAYALRNGVAAGFDQIANTLWNTSGLASLTGFSAGTFYRKDVAGALGAAGAGFSQIAHGIAAGISGTTLGNVAYALRNGVGAGFDQIANTLWYTSGLASLTGFSAGTFYRSDVASALGVAGGSFRDIAYGIAGGIGGTTLGNIVYALDHGVGATLDNIADALVNSGASQFFPGGYTISDVANAMSTINDDANAIANALSNGARVAWSDAQNAVSNLASAASNFGNNILNSLNPANW